MPRDPRALARSIASGDRRAAILGLDSVEDTRIEAEIEANSLLRVLRDEAFRAPLGVRPNAHRIGLTGAPGAGKSTLGGALARELGRRGSAVGVLAIDPSSEQSGGALLGDRLRIATGPTNERLLVRSQATNGSLGGLAPSAASALDVLGAFADVVLVETVGVGQSEAAIADVVDTVALLVPPGSGDGLQFVKSGLFECADLFVVGKADAGRAAQETRLLLERALGTSRPIVEASGIMAGGALALADLLVARAGSIATTWAARRARGSARGVVRALERAWGGLGVSKLGGESAALDRATELVAGGLVPREALARLGAEIAESLQGIRRNAGVRR
jgi:LAO/AO transport system kinase